MAAALSLTCAVGGAGAAFAGSSILKGHSAFRFASSDAFTWSSLEVIGWKLKGLLSSRKVCCVRLLSSFCSLMASSSEVTCPASLRGGAGLALGCSVLGCTYSGSSLRGSGAFSLNGTGIVTCAEPLAAKELASFSSAFLAMYTLSSSDEIMSARSGRKLSTVWISSSTYCTSYSFIQGSRQKFIRFTSLNMNCSSTSIFCGSCARMSLRKATYCSSFRRSSVRYANTEYVSTSVRLTSPPFAK
mmetsp:Transcript_29920/g.50349  ORF Transcript_29920/g.50349 Transcript_29920/m.50349 type:complete len:244 (+) Transcript_29920:1404-2135(+)